MHDESPSMRLNKIFRRLKVAKGDREYSPLYGTVIGPRRLEPLHLFEVGIFKGKSLTAWVEWMPNATITGMDTFERIPPEALEILNHERVRWFRQSSTGLPPDAIGPFDFIIDDGCHWHCAQRMTFRRYWPLLKPGGSYFIEDVWPFDLMSAEDKRHPWILDHPGAWTDEQYLGLLREIHVGNVRHHDFRGDENTDRYVLEVRK